MGGGNVAGAESTKPADANAHDHKHVNSGGNIAGTNMAGADFGHGAGGCRAGRTGNMKSARAGSQHEHGRNLGS